MINRGRMIIITTIMDDVHRNLHIFWIAIFGYCQFRDITSLGALHRIFTVDFDRLILGMLGKC